MRYEALLVEANDEGVSVKEKPLEYGLKGVYCNGRVIIKNNLVNVEKACVLAEELGHHYTSIGNIIDQRDVGNRKQEATARQWAYKKMIPLNKLVRALESGARTSNELAEYLGVTEQFLQDAITRYKGKYGKYRVYEDKVIYFEPLGILKKI